MAQCPVNISNDPQEPRDTVQAADAGCGTEVKCEERARPTGAAQWLVNSTGGGPGWHGRLLGGGGHSVVTRTVHNARPRSDSCSLERKDSLSDRGWLLRWGALSKEGEKHSAQNSFFKETINCTSNPRNPRFTGDATCQHAFIPGFQLLAFTW